MIDYREMFQAAGEMTALKYMTHGLTESAIQAGPGWVGPRGGGGVPRYKLPPGASDVITPLAKT